MAVNVLATTASTVSTLVPSPVAIHSTSKYSLQGMSSRIISYQQRCSVLRIRSTNWAQSSKEANFCVTLERSRRQQSSDAKQTCDSPAAAAFIASLRKCSSSGIAPQTSTPLLRFKYDTVCKWRCSFPFLRLSHDIATWGI
eukprot:3941878-Rhodomonas_salina.2